MSAPSAAAVGRSAPHGRLQPPPSCVEERALGADLRVRRAASSIAVERARGSRRRRPGTPPRARPGATCGSSTDGSSALGDRGRRARAGRARPRRRRSASNSAGLLEAGRDVAAQLAEREVGPQRGELGAPAHRARSPTRAPGRAARRACDPTSASRGSPRSGTAASTRPAGVPAGRSLAECTARSARPSSTALLHLLHEHAGAAERVDRRRRCAVAAGRDDDELDVAPPRQRRRRVRPASGRARCRASRRAAARIVVSPVGRRSAGRARRRGRRARRARRRTARRVPCRPRPSGARSGRAAAC